MLASSIADCRSKRILPPLAERLLGPNTGGIAPITDQGYQLQSSAMVIQKVLQVYLSGAQIFGRFGDASELRAGGNWYFTKQRGLRVNVEFIQLNNSPVGYTAVPHSVGATARYTASTSR